MSGYFANLGVQVKIWIIVAVGVLVALAIGLLGLHALNGAAGAAHRIYANNLSSMNALGLVSTAMAQARLSLANQILSGDVATTTKYAQAFESDLRAVETALAAYRDSGPAADDRLVAALETNWASYADIATRKQVPAGHTKDITAWQQIRDSEVAPLTAKVGEIMAQLRDAEEGDAASSAAKAAEEHGESKLQTVVVLVSGTLVAILLSVLISRSIVRSLRRVKEVCEGLAAGDLTRTSGLTSADETGQMGGALDAAMLRLRGTVSTIDASATSLAGATAQMSGATDRIAASAIRTSEQAQAVSAAAEQISRSVDTVSAGSEQMGASIREISRNASEAAQVAAEAVGLASRTSATMNQLGESSSEIGNVIKTITSIAEQTNLLALNATIEAARAGEAGKGFARMSSELTGLVSTFRY